ncbi:MAG: hypothetical protein MZV64_19520 [Ignavibacteriales bacterium]|nr:hypothetical protein [Ignavibacteriales bacterium]
MANFMPTSAPSPCPTMAIFPIPSSFRKASSSFTCSSSVYFNSLCAVSPKPHRSSA